METIYNKLVRDRIDEIMISEGEEPQTRILDDEEYRVELYRKLEEECSETVFSTSRKELLSELGDVLEVIRTIALLENSSLDEIIELSNQKRDKKGGFERRLYIEKSIKKDME